MKILLTTIKNPITNDEGRVYSWTVGDTICEFYSVNQAMDYIEANIQRLPSNIQFFCGSASVLATLNRYLLTVKESAYGN